MTVSNSFFHRSVQAALLFLAVAAVPLASAEPPTTGSTTLATFTPTRAGDHVDEDDLAAYAYVLAAPLLEVTFEKAAAVKLDTPERRQAAIRAIAFNRVLGSNYSVEESKVPSRQRDLETILREELLAKIYQDERIRPQLAAQAAQWDKNARAVYEARRDELTVPAKISFRYIFAGDPDSTPTGAQMTEFESDIRRAEEALRKGEDFVEVARKYSKSRPPVDRGAIVGPFLLDAIPPDRRKELDQLADKSLSPPFKTGKGYMIIYREKLDPARLPAFEDTTATLVENGWIKRFLREGEREKATQEVVARYPLTMHLDRLKTSGTRDMDAVVAECALFKISNRDIFTRDFVRGTPDPEEKDFLAAINQIARRRVFAELARREFAEDPRYARAIRILDERLAGGRIIAAELATRDTCPIVRDYAKHPEECEEAVLKVADFKIVSPASK